MEPLKAEPQEVFGGPNTDPHKVFGRLGIHKCKSSSNSLAGDFRDAEWSQFSEKNVSNRSLKIKRLAIIMHVEKSGPQKLV